MWSVHVDADPSMTHSSLQVLVVVVVCVMVVVTVDVDVSVDVFVLVTVEVDGGDPFFFVFSSLPSFLELLSVLSFWALWSARCSPLFSSSSGLPQLTSLWAQHHAFLLSPHSVLHLERPSLQSYFSPPCLPAESFSDSVLPSPSTEAESSLSASHGAGAIVKGATVGGGAIVGGGGGVHTISSNRRAERNLGTASGEVAANNGNIRFRKAKSESACIADWAG
mmetsp:Transcript_3306/g.7933  ORF Transcript_3306/g.7933 Transcript_3306/m.7933 type:complete len:222 (-) Transcript_3306:51-716(-)